MHALAIERETPAGTVSLADLAERLDREIHHLERLPARGAGGGAPAPLLPQEIRRELRFLRQLAAGMACADPGPVWLDRAGFGSVLLVRDLHRGRDHFRKLVTHRVDPLDLAQRSLSTETGRALSGRRPGDEVEMADGGRTARWRVLTLTTLPARLRMRRGA